MVVMVRVTGLGRGVGLKGEDIAMLRYYNGLKAKDKSVVRKDIIYLILDVWKS